MRIFLIEDDKALAEGISFTLQKEGCLLYTSDAADDYTRV